MDWRSQPKGGDLKPRISITGMRKRQAVETVYYGLPANYFLSTDAVITAKTVRGEGG
jgi:DNA-directed RNA polymerase subunit beta'